MDCPECNRTIIRIGLWKGDSLRGWIPTYPQGVTRPIPPEIVDEYAEDFKEAVAVATLSPKASAALSRRLLQHILREKAGVQHGTLTHEIDEIIEKNVLPADLADDLDALRQVGNFAAHPTKETRTGEIVDVEPEEAAWLLDLLEELLDFYFVRPAIRKQKRSQINKKLEGASKPLLKGSADTESEPPR